jgi:uncharacterized protein YggU (UPF0235/DUF167 family)
MSTSSQADFLNRMLEAERAGAKALVVFMDDHPRHGDAWKVRVAEPPEAGRANDGVVRLLGDTLGVAVSVVAGHSSRDKVVSCALDAAEAERLLSEASGKERA